MRIVTFSSLPNFYESECRTFDETISVLRATLYVEAVFLQM
jgi:hypothetical protein